MKKIASLPLAIIFALAIFIRVNAQAAETIWLTANAATYKTGETAAISINAISNAKIQGVTFQISYDPACLQPLSATSPVQGMNGLPLPQTPGLVDATFASSAPQTANGVVAEVRFRMLGECQTNLTLESAALATRDANGFAKPLEGIAIGEKKVALKVSKEAGSANLPEPFIGGTPLVLGPVDSSAGEFPSWLVILFSLLAGVIGVLVAINLLRKP